MRTQWLARGGSAELTLVFGGWGLGSAPFEELTGAPDVLFVDDYRQIDTGLPETAQYDHVRLLAYSFGVASALHWLAGSGLHTERRVAVNGTPHPADRTRGIAPEMVAATADGLSPASFAGFCRRAGHPGAPPDIDIPAAQAELRAIAARGPGPEIPFDRIWISERDRIVPRPAQEAAWAAQSGTIRHIPTPHQPFRPGQSWEEWFA
ncbi:MAG: pimeloyl-ACP methyl esterase BioG family protein [Ruegeria sp.]|uniref:pimeloyl-ACP methyl esterase BioG family protein n=1 Tax=Ruegeria sp. TaxID=1879320 RepID=UPI00349E623A